MEILEERSGLLVFRVDGTVAEKTFRNEAGGHRWQRCPPTEKKGRVHTSTITVAVLPVPSGTEITLNMKDVRIVTCRGSGPGGQARNKLETAVQATHIPSGLSVRCENEKSQHRNRQMALDILRARLWEIEKQKTSSNRSASRKSQIGSGMRGDKRRTIRVQDGVVTDHVLNKKWRLKEYLRGDW